MEIKKGNKIEKRNDLNDLRANHMTIQQLRFFAIYLSRINARDPSTRLVRFSLDEFRTIMGLGKLNIRNLVATTDGLLQQIIHIPSKKGGYDSFQLFKRCKVLQDDYGEWYVEIDAHDEAVPLFFEFKEKYFIYELGNVLRLTSTNKIRMYEILKQRQKMKQPVRIDLKTLRDLLGIKPVEYPKFSDFKRYVLEQAKIELESQTDIKFSYEKVTKGRRVIAIDFYVSKNDKSFPQLSIAEYIQSLPPTAYEDEPADEREDESKYLDDSPLTPSRGLTMDYSEALPSNLSSEEVEVLRGLAVSHIDKNCGLPEIELHTYDYLMEKTRLLYAQKKKVPERNYFAWLRKAVDRDWK